jgi:outer membrane protein assembly factor BamA
MKIFGMLLFGATFVDAGMVTERRDIALAELRITPGVGVRMPSMLGPIRLDIGFNPYPPQKGPLYQQVGSDLQLIDAAYAPSLRFIDRLQLHLSIGQAF